MQRIRRTVNDLAYRAFCVGTKLAQAPAVIREGTPRILSDEVTTPVQGDRFAIVVKYAKFGLTEDFTDLLAALKRARVNAIVVCNGHLAPEEAARLRSLAHRIMVRPNIGRDMGAYRAATLHLHRSGLMPSRVLYFNDSVIYLRGQGLDDMVAALAESSYDVAGTFENHEFAHHVGTYAFSISGAVFADRNVQRFWRRYRPYDLRPYAIRRGEVAYTECVRRCGYRIDVIYSADKLASRLGALPFHTLVEHLRYIPFGAFRDYAINDLIAGAVKTGALLYRKAPESAPPPARTPRLSDYRSRTVPTNEEAEAHAQFLRLSETMKSEVLINHMMGLIINCSQVHYGFGLFHRVMGSPLVKKDLLVRGVFFEHDCTRILDTVPAERRNGIMRELISRGRPVNFDWMRRFRLRHGLI
ncbi:rhamnan synthesis F family protein [Neoroseomonas soli]|uniref:Lipopolysaccharide biosynthesis protein n=1 Tax=Neoroseomonas soli TaxID=1081025 RepID=A0A9X9X408_9PROT|nr:rhamnan synthesis F family protein [Neoroseomonas soli]MBR0674137.1 lipopolysaccharide biosynthesis protein [Neoroseomonas soli]